MQRARSEKQVNRQQNETLASQYRAIGPAAIMAALIYARASQQRSRSSPPRAA
jgi:uncharacterized protein (DUF433 family)